MRNGSKSESEQDQEFKFDLSRYDHFLTPLDWYVQISRRWDLFELLERVEDDEDWPDYQKLILARTKLRLRIDELLRKPIITIKDLCSSGESVYDFSYYLYCALTSAPESRGAFQGLRYRDLEMFLPALFREILEERYGANLAQAFVAEKVKDWLMGDFDALWTERDRHRIVKYFDQSLVRVETSFSAEFMDSDYERYKDRLPLPCGERSRIPRISLRRHCAYAKARSKAATGGASSQSRDFFAGLKRFRILPCMDLELAHRIKSLTRFELNDYICELGLDQGEGEQAADIRKTVLKWTSQLKSVSSRKSLELERVAIEEFDRRTLSGELHLKIDRCVVAGPEPEETTIQGVPEDEEFCELEGYELESKLGDENSPGSEFSDAGFEGLPM